MTAGGMGKEERDLIGHHSQIPFASSKISMIPPSLVDTTALCWAAGSGNVALIKELLENGAEVNRADYDLRTPLHIAVDNNKIQAVKVLLEKGADIRREDRWGRSALEYAKQKQDSVISTIMLNYTQSESANVLPTVKAASLSTSLSENVSREAFNLVASGNTESLKRLWMDGADVNVIGEDGSTLLHHAVSKYQQVMIELLLAAGIDYGVRDEHGRTALDLAQQLQNIAAVELLEDRLQPIVRCQREDMIRAFDAASTGNIKEIHSLLATNMNVNASDYDRRSLLHVASAEGKVEVVRELIRLGGDVNHLDRWGNSPLCEAIAYAHNDVAHILREHGARESLHAIVDYCFDDLDGKTLSTALEYAMRMVANGRWMLGEAYCPIKDRDDRQILALHNVWHRKQPSVLANHGQQSHPPQGRMHLQKQLSLPFLLSADEIHTIDPIALFHKAKVSFFIDPGYGLVGKVFRSKEPVWIRDISTVPQSEFFFAPLARRANIKSLVSVPMVHKDGVVGVLSWYATETREEDAHEIRLIQKILKSITVLLGLYRDIQTTNDIQTLPTFQFCQALDSAISGNGDLYHDGTLTVEQARRCNVLPLALEWRLFDVVDHLATSMSSEDHTAVVGLLLSLSKMKQNHFFSSDNCGIANDLNTTDTIYGNTTTVMGLLLRMEYYAHYLVAVSPAEGTLLLQSSDILMRLQSGRQSDADATNIHQSSCHDESDDAKEHFMKVDLPSQEKNEEQEEEECFLCKFQVPGHIHRGKDGRIALRQQPGLKIPTKSHGTEFFGIPGNPRSPIFIRLLRLHEELCLQFDAFPEKEALMDRSWEGYRNTDITPRDLYDAIGHRHATPKNASSSRRIRTGSVPSLPLELSLVANDILHDRSCLLSYEQLFDLHRALDLEEPEHRGQLRSTSAVGYASPTLYRVFLPCGEIIEALQYVISLLILPSLASSSSPRNVSRSALHVHPLLLSYYIFASLVFYIHPFCDGNGRLARLVANLVAKKEGYAMPLTASTDKTVQLDAFLRTALHRLVHCENLRRREHKTKTRSSAEQSTSTWF